MKCVCKKLKLYCLVVSINICCFIPAERKKIFRGFTVVEPEEQPISNHTMQSLTKRERYLLHISSCDKRRKEKRIMKCAKRGTTLDRRSGRVDKNQTNMSLQEFGRHEDGHSGRRDIKMRSSHGSVIYARRMRIYEWRQDLICSGHRHLIRPLRHMEDDMSQTEFEMNL